MTSLSTRIALSVTVLLAVCGAAAGIALHGALRQAAESQLQARLDARLAWLAASLDVEMDDGEIQLDVRDELPGAAEAWEVADADGTVLWSGGGEVERPVGKTTRLTFGPSGGPAVQADSLVMADAPASGRSRPSWERVTLDKVPPAALAAARAAKPHFEPTEAWQRARVKKKELNAPVTYDVRGRVKGHGGGGGGNGAARGREYDVRVDASGKVEAVRSHDAGRYPAYQFPAADGRRLDLLVTARASAVEVEAELAATSRLLWTLGPLALLATAGVLTLAIRWQLRPLARMAEQAAAVGPANVGGAAAGRVGPAGTSAELAGLRAAINSMLDRLADALHRERRFAATAAHELRTPLAQMRLTLDVALRRDRDKGEYREALVETSEDLGRLERLVVALLQLARAHGAAGDNAGVVQLGPLIGRAVAAHGPATVDVASMDGLWVRGDADLLGSALGNVLENAGRYAPGTPAEVRVEATAERVRVIVADRGAGVPEGERERIFEPLTRLATGAAAEGFGLGLAVARDAARAVGGELTCRGRVDGAGGAEFVFDLPRADAPDAAGAD
jgi:signal transduction histidine kinase